MTVHLEMLVIFSDGWRTLARPRASLVLRATADRFPEGRPRRGTAMIA